MYKLLIISVYSEQCISNGVTEPLFWGLKEEGTFIVHNQKSNREAMVWMRAMTPSPAPHSYATVYQSEICVVNYDAKLNISCTQNSKHSLIVRWIDPSLWTHWAIFRSKPVLHGWCNKRCGMCYPVCGMMHINVSLLLIKSGTPCGGTWFPLSLSEWFFNICPTPYNRN